MTRKQRQETYKNMIRERIRLERQMSDLDRRLLTVALIDPGFVIDFMDGCFDNRDAVREFMRNGQVEPIEPEERDWRLSLYRTLYRVASKTKDAESINPSR